MIPSILMTMIQFILFHEKAKEKIIISTYFSAILIFILFFLVIFCFFLSFHSLMKYMLTPGGWGKSKMHRRKGEKRTRTMSLNVCLFVPEND